MKESIGYTVTLNIVIVFIVIVFAFLAASLSYFKANKISNTIRDSIEKYEGYNDLSKEELTIKISSLGYNMGKVSCNKIPSGCEKAANSDGSLVDGTNGYCVYLCEENDYYYYKIGTNMTMNIPIINSILPIRIFSNTNRMYDFESALGVLRTQG